MILKYLNLAIGYFLLLVGCIGCVVLLGILFGFSISDAQAYIFIPLLERPGTSTPLFLAGVTAVGAYLVKN